ncbi:MAG: 4Fe-4S binding protein, partial [Pseudomonadota bacterium]|nr:4Fe-4S binding protein [Pseudomonadota bacterium]
VEACTQACRSELDRVRRLLGTGAPLTIGCTQEAPLFTEVAEELDAEDRVIFANIRENAGWSNEAALAAPKMAALLAAAAEPTPPIHLVTMESRGVTLVYGREEAAIEAARRLADQLDITVLLTKPGDVTPPRVTDFPVLKGTITGATGHLGAFELRVDDYALPSPSSRQRLVFGEPRNGATSSCDIILDLSGGMPLFPAHELRSGYLRADPRDPTAVERVLARAASLVGTFDKPRYISFSEGLCAHSRSKITGCTRCLDLCPTGAIGPAGDHVAIDAYICAGCGSCAAACPTGAAAYALPPADALIRRLRALMSAYALAGGRNAVVLFHDGDHGEPLIDALARFGDGLPANVLPVRVNEVTQVGPEAVAALFAYGASGARFLTRAKPKHDLSGLHRTAGTANLILEGLGFGRGVVSVIETDDPDSLRAALDRAPLGTPTANPAGFLPHGAKRGVLELAFRELHRAAPAPVDVVALPAGSPFGGLDHRADACTLCLACVSACPTHALTDNTEKPMLRFTESLCVQCGLCAATCPEDAIGLVPQLDFKAWENPRRLLKEEEPFHCIACAKPFGTKSTIERVVRKLQDQHWMFSGAAGQERVRVLMMCEDCRVEAVVNESFDPHAMPPRPNPRTTEDYLREREANRLKSGEQA